MIKEIIKIEGMSCSHCVKSVEQALSKHKLSAYKVTIGRAEVSYEPSNVFESEIYVAIKNAGYSVIKETRIKSFI